MIRKQIEEHQIQVEGVLGNMDIAAMSVVMSNHQVRADASLAVMNNAMDLMEQQGLQLMEMLEQPMPTIPHPSLGNMVDIRL